MRFKGYLVIVCCLFYTSGLLAQAKNEYTTSRILILLDRSSSMIQQWGGVKSKSKAADELILKLIDSVYQVNPDVEFSLRVFGHQYTVPENNCHDTRNEVPFSKDNRTRMAFRLEDIQPQGVTSIAYALEQAAKFDLVDEAYNAYSILLITDGGESCGGDICAVMRTLINNKIYFKPYIISLEDYAPLKATYSCMGDYLQVLKEGDMVPAVGTIVNAFRPILKIKTADFKELQTIAANAPSVLKVNVPVIPPAKPAALPIAGVQPVGLKTIPMKIRGTKPLTTVPQPKFEPIKVAEEPAPVEETPVRPEPVKITALQTAKLRKLAVEKPELARPEPVAEPASVKPLVIEEAPPERPAPQKISYAALSLKLLNIEPPKQKKPKQTSEPELPRLVIDTPVAPKPVADKIAKLQPVKLRQFGIMWVVEERSLVTRPVPPLPPAKIDAAAVAAVAPKPVKTAPEPEGKTSEYTIDREDAKETTLEVYFTNGRGKFYETTPQVLLLDATSGKLIKRFYRTVGPTGNPDPQKDIPAGTYNLTFSETNGPVVRNVKIEKDKKNKIVVKVNNASLSFEYSDARNSPVLEFSARVIERNKPEGGRIQDQRCSEKLEYDPGNYHVIINTFPQDVRNLDLEFNEKVIAIARPGFAKFTSDPALNTVDLYQRLGDKFLKFHTLNLHDAVSQHLRIQPGEYQAHYHKGPGGPSASEKVVTFIIRTTQETEVELK